MTVLQYFKLDHVNKNAYIGYDVLFFFGYSILAYLALSFVRHDKR